MKSFFRLKINENGQQKKYSSTIVVNPNCYSVSPQSITPNPASTVIEITGMTSQSEIQIFNTAGQKVWSGLRNNQDRTIEISSLTNGFHLLRMIDIGRFAININHPE